MGKLLRQGTAPGHANRIDLTVVEVIEHARSQFGQTREAVWRTGRGGAADTGHVEGDNLQAGVQGAHERHDQLQVGPDAVKDQQRGHLAVTGANRGADGLAVQFNGTEYER